MFKARVDQPAGFGHPQAKNFGKKAVASRNKRRYTPNMYS